MVKILITLLSVIFSITAFAGEVKLGALFSETGPASYLGHPEKLTAEMLIEQINAAGGISGDKVVLISYDTQAEEQRTISQFKRLVTKDRVFAVIGPSTTGASLAIKDMAEKYKVPLISCAASAAIVNPVNKFVFKTPQTDVLAAERIYRYMKEKGMKTAALLTSQSGFGTTGRDALMSRAADMGIEIVADEKFGDKDKDMTSQLGKIKAVNPDAVICWGVGPAPAIVAKNARDLGMANVLMSHGVASAKFIELAGDSAEGIKLPAGRLAVTDRLEDSDPFKSLLTKYKSDYESKYSLPVSSFGGYAYDAVYLFKAAYEKSGKNTEKFAAALASVKGFMSATGEFNMTETDHNGLSSDAFVMVEIKNGNFELVK